jgi:TRAP-type C4-dicarboxylate transport system permease small subunit
VRRWVARVDLALERTLVALMAIMVVNVLWQVATRYLLHSPSSFTEELARFLLIWLGLLGSCYALRRRMHVAIEALTERLRPGVRRFAGLVSLALVATFALAVMVVGGLLLVRLTLQLEQTSAALGLPLGWVYLALPAAGALVAFYAAVAAAEMMDATAERE